MLLEEYKKALLEVPSTEEIRDVAFELIAGHPPICSAEVDILTQDICKCPSDGHFSKTPVYSLLKGSVNTIETSPCYNSVFPRCHVLMCLCVYINRYVHMIYNN